MSALQEAQRRLAEAKEHEVKEVHAMRRKFKAEREAQHREVVAKARRKHQAVKGKEGGAQRALEARKVRCAHRTVLATRGG